MSRAKAQRKPLKTRQRFAPLRLCARDLLGGEEIQLKEIVLFCRFTSLSKPVKLFILSADAAAT
jgi:hypothetical protein